MPNLSRREADALLADLAHLIAQATVSRRDILDAQPSGSIPFDPAHLAAAVEAVEDDLARLTERSVVPHV